ncbi:NAD(P)-dependent oxidoreductase [Flavobacterium suaedae]|uniref:NAD(P)-dependent oxidoreductase n=1 Tax=Flavobacterium suaedae TaxID=1767027 RepID=A0ABQ1JEH2_9FLAO|nr:SDR family oxidoreductase [Flavobacterium suaedae]GGB66502.1 NAD(P)-dependent oxidoreductase [Flavobacterium suaedae]
MKLIMILITGATGHLGNKVIENLLKSVPASEIKALARDEQKAANLKEKGVTIATGDYENIPALDNAMKGINKVLLISGLDENRLEQHKNVIDAAKRAGVERIVYTSVSMTDVSSSVMKDFMGSHFQTEDYIKESGLEYTLMRNSLYMDVIPMFIGEKPNETGVVLPAGEGKVAFALRTEMAEALANVLADDTHANKVYDITNTEAYSFNDIAVSLSELYGKEIKYTSPDADVFAKQLKEYSVPDFAINLTVGFATDIKNNLLNIVSTDLESILNRKPATLKKGLKELYAL